MHFGVGLFRKIFWTKLGVGFTLPLPYPLLSRYPTIPPGTLCLLTVPGSIVWSGYKDNFLVAAGHGFHLSFKRSPGCPHQQQAVLGLNGLQGLGELLLEAFGVRLENTGSFATIILHYGRSRRSLDRGHYWYRLCSKGHMVKVMW